MEQLSTPAAVEVVTPAATMVRREYNVVLYNRARVESALTDLAKRAKRKHLEGVFSWTWGKVTSHHDEFSGKVTHHTISLVIEGEEPKYNGWTFLAALDHLCDEAGAPINVMRSTGDVKVPEQYRNRGPVCDHCKAKRRRGNTFVVRHEDGRTMQVGSTCIGDFLGADAFLVARRAEMLAQVMGMGLDDDGMGFGGSGVKETSVDSFLATVAACIRELGWLPRGKAREQGGLATADIAWIIFWGPMMDIPKDLRHIKVTDADAQRAEAALEWAESLTETESDYLHNINAIARANLVTPKTLGLAASIVGSYERELGKRAERERVAAAPSHFGTVGKRETFKLTLVAEFSMDTAFGTKVTYKFQDENGTIGIWKTSPVDALRRGNTYLVTGTVKDHGHYKGVPQTLLSRCAVKALEVTPAVG